MVCEQSLRLDEGPPEWRLLREHHTISLFFSPRRSVSPPVPPSQSLSLLPPPHDFIVRGRSCYAFEGASCLSSLFDALCIKALLSHFPLTLAFLS